MKKRSVLYTFFIFTCTCLLLTGCLGTTRMETVILNEPEQASSDHEVTPFTVETIYSILETKMETSHPIDDEMDIVYPFGWLDANSLLGFAFSYPSGKVRFGRINEPYTSEQKIFELNSNWRNIPLGSVALSPDQSYVSYINWVDNIPEIYLHSLEDGGDIQLDIDISNINSRMSWSNNSRFFSFASEDEISRAVELHVYDILEETLKSYTVPAQQEREYISYVTVSDNEEEAVIIKHSGQNSVLEWGKLEDETFTPHFQHQINNEGWVDWLHQDQIIFVGADNTLYAYDQRNDLLSVLLHDIRRFQLSTDRKHIAYTQGEDSVYAGNIYGNSVINMTQIYKGIDVYHMQWGPDNTKLLVSGSKDNSYQRATETIALEPRSFEIIGTSYLQNLVIEFN